MHVTLRSAIAHICARSPCAATGVKRNKPGSPESRAKSYGRNITSLGFARHRPYGRSATVDKIAFGWSRTQFTKIAHQSRLALRLTLFTSGAVVLFSTAIARTNDQPNREPQTNSAPSWFRVPTRYYGAGIFHFWCGMKVARNVFAVIFFGLGAAFIFGATHTVDSTFASFETATLGGVGAMILLGSFLLLRR